MNCSVEMIQLYSCSNIGCCQSWISHFRVIHCIFSAAIIGAWRKLPSSNHQLSTMNFEQEQILFNHPWQASLFFCWVWQLRSAKFVSLLPELAASPGSASPQPPPFNFNISTSPYLNASQSTFPFCILATISFNNGPGHRKGDSILQPDFQTQFTPRYGYHSPPSTKKLYAQQIAPPLIIQHSSITTVSILLKDVGIADRTT